MKKIVLVQPKSHETWEALNIGYLGAFLKMHGFDRIDFYSGFYDSDDRILSGCADADIVGFSCASPQMKHAIELAAALKKENPGVWTVAGGVHVSSLPGERFPGIDQIVVGEGEAALLSVVQGNREPLVQGMPVGSLDSLPFPDRHLIKEERQITEFSNTYHEQRIGSIISSRGCPFACKFCASHNVWGRKTRFRSPARILDEFRSIVEEFQLDMVRFCDDTFTLNKECVTQFCQRKIEQGITTPWICNIRVDTVNQPLLELMRKAGCCKLWIGVESGSPKVLGEMNKRITPDQVRQTFAWTKEMGFSRSAYILLGTPAETADDLRLTDELLEEIKADTVLFFLLVPYPGTAYYDPERHQDVDFSHIDFLDDRLSLRKIHNNSEWEEARNRLVKKYEKVRAKPKSQQAEKAS